MEEVRVKTYSSVRRYACLKKIGFLILALLINLNNKLNEFWINSRVLGPWKNNWNREYYCLIIKKTDFSKWR